MAQLKRLPEPKVSLLYFRPRDTSRTRLDEKLFDLAGRNRGLVRLVVHHSAERGELLGGFVSGVAPTVLFVRDGSCIAQMIGDLPLYEIERLLRSSLA
jgi:hypothetical protein